MTPIHGPSLGRRTGSLPPVARRHRVPQHLAHRLACDPELLGRSPLTLAFDQTRPAAPAHRVSTVYIPPVSHEPAPLHNRS